MIVKDSATDQTAEAFDRWLRAQERLEAVFAPVMDRPSTPLDLGLVARLQDQEARAWSEFVGLRRG
ncbi:hypothetical protein AB0J82_35190 [Asanoa sp. NPDC049518]|uniref:hypothetical protein n=1 Tax=unclassified Asanoa TaxID=2685164 RepID=UPI00341AC89A